jgi:hypothetical protein
LQARTHDDENLVALCKSCLTNIRSAQQYKTSIEIRTTRGEVNLYSFLFVQRGRSRTKFAFQDRNSPISLTEEQHDKRSWRTAPCAGQKKAARDKMLRQSANETEVVEFPNAVEFQGVKMPQPSTMLSAVQKDGKPLIASEIYKGTWDWLNERGCASIVSPQVLERYAMSAARWIQCEAAITEYGFLAKHPTTGSAIQSPYIVMSQITWRRRTALV